MLWKLFEGEMIIKNQITISHQIFLLFMFDWQVIFISIINPNDGCQGDLRHGKVNPSNAEATFALSTRMQKSLKTF